MKRIQTFAHFSRLSLAVLSACVLFASCDLFTYKRPFADAYYDDNFIAAINFDQFSGADTSVPATAVTGSWDCAYRYNTTDWSTSHVNYLTLTATGKTAGDYDTADGLSSSANVFRLEMANLIQNGDFESGLGTWTQQGTAVSTVSFLSSNGINNASANLALNSQYSWFDYAVPAVSLVTDQWYLIDFRWKSGDTLPSQVYMNGDSNLPFDFSTETNHATREFKAKTTNTIQFKATALWTSMIDDMSIRLSQNNKILLYLKKTDTNPPLEDFLYIFSIWVHADPSVGANTSPYHLDTMSLEMHGIDGASTMSPDTTNATYTYSSTASGWQKIYVRIDNGNLQINSSATGAVLQLIINLDKALPGRVLIAQPELRAYPDGY